MKKNGNRMYLSLDEALTVLPNSETIHTFYNLPNTLVGADWSKQDIEDKLKQSDIIEVCGDTARSMKHGICAYNEDTKWQSDILFIETDEEKLKALLKE